MKSDLLFVLYFVFLAVIILMASAASFFFGVYLLPSWLSFGFIVAGVLLIYGLLGLVELFIKAEFL